MIELVGEIVNEVVGIAEVLVDGAALHRPGIRATTGALGIGGPADVVHVKSAVAFFTAGAEGRSGAIEAAVFSASHTGIGEGVAKGVGRMPDEVGKLRVLELAQGNEADVGARHIEEDDAFFPFHGRAEGIAVVLAVAEDGRLIVPGNGLVVEIAGVDAEKPGTAA